MAKAPPKPKQPKPPEPRPEAILDVMFPTAGIDVADEYGRQPMRPLPDGSTAATASVGLNVRSFDPTTDRLRGGSRPGLSRFIDATVNGAYKIQDLNLLVDMAPGGDTTDCCTSGLGSTSSTRNTLGGVLGYPPVRHPTEPGRTYVWRGCLTITANDQATIVGTPIVLAGTEFTSVGLNAADTLTSVTLTCSGLGADFPGDFPIVPSAAVGVGLDKYKIQYVNGNLHVAGGG